MSTNTPLAVSPTAPDAESPRRGGAAAVQRVEGRALALREEQFTSMNVDVVGASNIALGSSKRILTYRPRMEHLPEFDLSYIDDLADIAKAAWFVAINTMPAPQPQEFQALVQEATDLRAHFLVWAASLVHAKKFDARIIDTIKQGSGNKDIAGDVSALATLYRGNWSAVGSICDIKMEQIERGEDLSDMLFSAIADRDEEITPSMSDGSLRLRRFWTLLDLAYTEAERGVSFFASRDGVDWRLIVPALRRNVGRGSVTPPDPTDPAPPAAPASTTPAAATPTSPIVPAVAVGPQGPNNGPFPTR